MLASLNWQHADFEEFLHVKDWDTQFVTKSLTVADAKRHNFDFPGRLDMTNISGNYDDHFLARVRRGQMPPTFRENIRQAMRTGEPGFLFNFGPHVRETLRNACGEVCSEDNADVCNLGSVNMSQIDSIERFRHVVQVGTAFLLLGSIHGELPLAQSYAVRDKNRRLGLGLMGVHEWLLRRGYRYEMVPELREWMRVYRDASNETASALADHFSVSRPKAHRAIAPTGTIGILAGTTTGIEPLFAVAYRRRFLKGKQWMAEFVVDGTAKLLIEEHGLDPDRIETSLDLAADVERRLAFQADMQDYVDQCISSTINLPSWASRTDPEGDVDKMAALVAKYAYRLRGATFYPDGARGGQPLTPVSYADAIASGSGARAEASDVCELTGKGGTCGA
jgi:ribonucleoside-diphosphate reductase alpha chain